MTNGYLHSLESFGAVDGPGIRFVVFFSGCPLRCLYCHNPDTWEQKRENATTAPALMQKIRTYKNFLRNGGVTLSGGEPLLQATFCEELLTLCRAEGLHTAIDTSGVISLAQSQAAIDLADMLLLDIKDIDANDCITLTGQSNANAIATLRYCEKTGKPVWIRHVLLPGYTLKQDKLRRMAAFLQPFSCIARVELLPYHTMGLYKWDSLGIPSRIRQTQPPADAEVAAARSIFYDLKPAWAGN